MPKSSRTRGVPYAVGYGRPPLETRFRPGQSGNPRGRPRKRPPEDPALASLDPLLAASLRVMSEPVPVSVGGRVRSVSGEEAVVRAVLDRALMGDNRSTRLLLDLRAQGQARLEQVRAQSKEMHKDTVEIVQLAARLIREAKRQERADLRGFVDGLLTTVRGGGPNVVQDEAGPGTAPGHGDPASYDATEPCVDDDTRLYDVVGHGDRTGVFWPGDPLPEPAPRVRPRGAPASRGGGEPVISSGQPLVGPEYGLGGNGRPAPACGLFD